MSEGNPILIVDQPCEAAIEGVIQQIGRTGLRVFRTFDLQLARHAQVNCPCPHHGTAQCDCQMVILLVYDGRSEFVSLVVHGHNGQTWFSIVDSPQQRADPRLEAAIRLALVPRNATMLLDQTSKSHEI